MEDDRMRRPRLGCLAVALAIAAFAALVIGGVMNGAIFQAALTPAAQAEPALATSQCEPVPAAASSSASAVAASSPAVLASPVTAAQLCVSVQAGQDSVKDGQTATWTISVSAQGGSIPAVIVTLTVLPAGTSAAFTSACPSGGGSASCDLGDMATALTPSSYLLQAQVTVPASAAAGTLTLTAAADAAATPAMTSYPAAGQVITIAAAKPTPSPAHRTPAAPPARQPPTYGPPPTHPATVPVATNEPALGAMPSYPVNSTTAPAGNVASVLPVITPAASIPTAPDPIASTPVADIQNIPAAASSSPQAGTFTLTIGMSAQTAEILGMVILALAIVLAATRIAATRIADPRRTRKQRPSRAERRAAREASWQRHLDGERKALPPPPSTR